jgi:hypothetical protein
MSFNKPSQNIYANWDNKSPLQQPKLLQLSGVFLVSDNDVRYILTHSLNEQKINSNLVLSASNIKINEKISSYNSDLILSSSKGSVLTFSGSCLNFTDDAFSKKSNINAINSDLILSSTSNSRVAISGGLMFVTDARPRIGSRIFIRVSFDIIIYKGFNYNVFRRVKISF